MNACLRLLLGIFAIAAVTTAAGQEASNFRVQAPKGTKAVVTQNGDVVEIQFLPQDSVAAPVETKPAATATPKTADAKKKLIEDQLAKEAKEASQNLDRPISAIPAFTALDVSPESVAHPSTPREFGAALLNGVDRHGVLQTGVAIETAPFRMIPGWKTNFEQYKGSYWTRFLYNFSLSLATAKATADENDKSVNLALGLQAILYQDSESDPLTNSDLRQAFHSTFTPSVVRSTVPVSGPMNTTSEAATAQKSFQEAVNKFRQEHWVGTLWTASIAPTWHSETGNAGDLEARGFTVWSTFAYAFDGPFGDHPGRFQAVAHLRYREGEMVTDPADSKHIAKQNSLLAAARLRFGSPNFNGFAEGAYLRIWNGLEGNGHAYRAAIGLERRIAENVWFVLSGGEQFGETGKTNELFALGSFRFGTSDSPTADMAPSAP